MDRIALCLYDFATCVRQSADELARQTQNPVSSPISFPFQANWDVGVGERQTTATTLNIQPVAPFPLTDDWNVILRVIMPLVSQPTDEGPRVGRSASCGTRSGRPAVRTIVTMSTGDSFSRLPTTTSAMGSPWAPASKRMQTGWVRGRCSRVLRVRTGNSAFRRIFCFLAERRGYHFSVGCHIA